MLWTAIIVSCVASLRFLAYQQWFMTKAATKAALDVSGVHEGIDAFEGYDAADHKYWHHWCPRNVFIGDSYSGWMICEPDDVTELSGAVVYSLGIIRVYTHIRTTSMRAIYRTIYTIILIYPLPPPPPTSRSTP